MFGMRPTNSRTLRLTGLVAGQAYLCAWEGLAA